MNADDNCGAKRFPMKLDGLWRPLLFLTGITASNSFLDLDASSGTVVVNFGCAFKRTLHLKNSSPSGTAIVRSCTVVDWKWWEGIGIHYSCGSRGRLGLTGSYKNVVQLELDSPLVWLWCFKVKRICCSMEDADGFCKAVSDLTAMSSER
jgi:hypothetical protein